MRTREENAAYMRQYMKRYRKNVDEIRYNKGFNGCLNELASNGIITEEIVNKFKKQVYERVDRRFK